MLCTYAVPNVLSLLLVIRPDEGKNNPVHGFGFDPAPVVDARTAVGAMPSFSFRKFPHRISNSRPIFLPL